MRVTTTYAQIFGPFGAEDPGIEPARSIVDLVVVGSALI